MDDFNQIKKWPAQSKSTWMDSAVLENPKLKLNSLVTTNEDGIELDPFSFHTDFKPFGHISLQGSTPANWKTGIEIGNEDLNQIIKFTQIALENGIEYIHFNFKKSISFEDVKCILDGVYLNMIFSRWSFSEPTVELNEILNHLVLQGGTDNILMTPKFNSQINGLSISSHFDFEVFNADQWCSRIIDILKTMVDTSGLNHQTILTIIPGSDFLRNIACIRALKAVLQKIISLYNFDHRFLVEASIEAVPKQNDPYQNMISLSAMSLAVSLAGCDFIMPSKNNYEEFKDPEQWIKSAVHVQHILKQEARLKGIEDPVSGSYFIDKLTLEYANLLWKKIQTSLKND